MKQPPMGSSALDNASHPKAWRLALIALCALTALLSLKNIAVTLTAEGHVPVFFAPTKTPLVERVTTAPPYSSVRAGDLIDFRASSGAERWRWFSNTAFTRGESYSLTLLGRGQPFRVAMTAQPYTPNPLWAFWLAVVGIFWMLLFAALVAWRRPASREARVLCLFLVLTVLGPQLYEWFPAPLVSALLYAVGYGCTFVAMALLVTYAMLFQPVSRLRTALSWLTYGFWALCVLYVAAWPPLSAWVLWLHPDAWYTSPAAPILYVLATLFSIACASVAIAEGTGADRARLTWATVPIGFYYFLMASALTTQLVAPRLAGWVISFQDVGLFVAPLGLTYALLNRKLLDVGFVLNRAAIFTTVSVVVVGVFVLVEWGFGEWLRDASRTANVIASAALALALGLSVRFVHSRIEHVVDNIFFRKRHEDETALRNFAHEAGYINIADTLVERTVAIIERHADASRVDAVLDADNDDPAIVALRAWHKPLDLHDVETALTGELAFPMVARGRLVGALVLGPKNSGETYAPDESDAIRQVANAVGLALDVLSLKTHASLKGDGAGMDAFAATVADLVARSLRAQPPEVTAVAIAPENHDAMICSYECTFCSECALKIHEGRCPNCGGDLQFRPARNVAPETQRPVFRSMGKVLLSGAMAVYNSQPDLAANLPDQWRQFRRHHPTLPDNAMFYGASPCTTDGKIHFLTGVAEEPSDGIESGERLVLDAGEYAMVRVDDPTLLRDAWNWLLGTWLPASGRREKHAPEFERYRGISEDGLPLGGAEIWIPLEPLAAD